MSQCSNKYDIIQHTSAIGKVNSRDGALIDRVSGLGIGSDGNDGCEKRGEVREHVSDSAESGCFCGEDDNELERTFGAEPGVYLYARPTLLYSPGIRKVLSTAFAEWRSSYLPSGATETGQKADWRN